MARSHWTAPIFVVLLAGCLSARAADDEDVIVLKSGATYVGTILETREGKYWIQLEGGKVISVPYADVERVDQAAAQAPRRTSSASSSSGRSSSVHGERRSGVSGGFDVGTFNGGRLRFNTDSAAIHHVDIRLGTGLAIASSVGPAILAAGEVAFFNDSIFHLAVGLGAGVAFVSGVYPAGGLLVAGQIDPRGPVQVQLGTFIGAGGSQVGIIPDVGVAFVW